MRELALVALSAVLMATPSPAQVQPFPAGFKTQTIATNGTRIFVRVGGHGPAEGPPPRVWGTGGDGGALSAPRRRPHTLVRAAAWPQRGPPPPPRGRTKNNPPPR